LPVFLPSSRTISLTVVSVSSSLADFKAPSSARVNTPITVRAVVANGSTIALPLWAEVRDRDTREVVGARQEKVADPMAMVTFEWTLSMPGKDWNLECRGGHRVADRYYEGDGSPKYATVKVEIPTALTLSVSPVTVAPGGSVRASGKLTRTDTGAGLAGMDIDILVNTTKVGTARTASDGSYTLTFTAPTVPGSYTVKASFAGVTLSVLLPSEAKTEIYVGIAPPLPWTVLLSLVPPVVVGATIVASEITKTKIM